MNKKQIVTILTGLGDKETVRIEGDETFITLTLQHNYRTIQHRFEQPHKSAEADWKVTCLVGDLLQTLNKLKKKGKLTFTFNNEKLGVSTGEEEIQYVPLHSEPLDFDPRAGKGISVPFSRQEWGYLESAAYVASLNREDGLYKEFVYLKVQSGFVTLIARTPSLTYNHSWKLATEEIDFTALISVEDINLISSFNPKAVHMTFQYHTAIADIDGKVLVAFPLGMKEYTYPSNLPIGDNTLEVEKSALEEAIAKVIGKAKDLTLSLTQGKLLIKNGKQTAEVPTDADTKIKASIKVAASALMEVLRAINTTKLHLFLFPGTSIAFEVASGAFYVLLGLTKGTIELSEAISFEPTAERKLLEERSSFDGTTTVMELVEVPPISPESGDIKQNLAKLQEQGKKVSDEAEKAVQQLEHEVEEIDKDLKESDKITKDTLKQDPQDKALADALAERKAELDAEKLALKEQKQLELKRIQEGKEKLDEVLEQSRQEGDLEAIALRLIWGGGRMWEIVFHAGKTWQIEARVIERKN